MDQIAGDALKAVKTYAAALMAMTGPLTEAALNAKKITEVNCDA